MDIAVFRKILPYLIVVVVLVAVFYLSWKRPEAVDDFKASSLSSDRSGYIMLRNFSRELGSEMVELTRPISDEFVDLDDISQLWIVAPNNIDVGVFNWASFPLETEEVDKVMGWIESGGTLVLSPGYVNPESIRPVTERLGVNYEVVHWTTDSKGRVRLPLYPDSDSPLMDNIEVVDSYLRFNKKMEGSILRFVQKAKIHEVFLEDQYGAAAVSVIHGSGKVIIFTDQYMFSNFLLGDETNDNAQFAANILAIADDGKIMIDEFHQGKFKLKSLSAILKTKAGRGIIILLIAIGLAVYSYSRRFGPIRPTTASGGRSPSEYAESMGNLFRRARANDLALDVLERDLSLFLRERFRLNILDYSAARDKLNRMNSSDSKEIESILDDIERLKNQPKTSLKALLNLSARIDSLKGARG